VYDDEVEDDIRRHRTVTLGKEIDELVRKENTPKKTIPSSPSTYTIPNL